MIPIPLTLVAFLALIPPPPPPDEEVAPVVEEETPPEPEATPEAAPAATAGVFTVHRKFRLHIDGELLGFQHSKQWFEEGEPTSSIPAESNSAGIGVGRHNFGFGLGYGITDGLIIGAKVGLGFTHTQTIMDEDVDEPDPYVRTLNWVFRPYLEYAFIPGGRFRPFLFIQGGPSGGRTVNTSSDDTSTKTISNTIGGTLGGGGGIHLFVIPQLSFDIFAHVNHYWFATRNRALVEGDPPDGPDPRYLRTFQSTEVGALLGISIWLP